MDERLPGRAASTASRAQQFEDLVSPWVAEMYRAAAAIAGPESAEDIAQEALLDAWRGLNRLRDASRVRWWLHAIVANRARKHLRAARSRPRVINVRVPELAAGDVAAEVAERDRLDRAFSQLSVDQRVCLAYRYSLDLPVAEVAELLHVPEGTVKSRIHAALARLRDALGEDDQ